MSKGVGFVDCGANIGYWTLFSTKICGVEHFVCIEPNPEVVPILRENLASNSLYPKIIENAISHQTSSGNVDFFIDTTPGMHAGSSIFEKGQNSLKRIEVPILPLNEILKDLLDSVDRLVIKFDVEGAEVVGFEQIDESIRDKIYIIYEDHGKDLESRPTAWLLNHGGYKIYFLGEKFVREVFLIDDALKFKKRFTVGYNFLAVPK